MSILFFSNQLNAAVPVQPAIGGAWYNSSEEGHGFIINISENTNGQLVLLATWYVYDNEGKQMWLLGSVPFNEGNMNVTVPVMVTQGAFFNNFASSDVEKIDWGTLTFEFSDCNTGVVRYEPVRDFPSGELAIQRLTNTAGIDCTSEPIPTTDTSNEVPGGDENNLEVLSVSVKSEHIRLICSASITVRNNNSNHENTFAVFDAFAGDIKVGEGHVHLIVEPNQTVTRTNYFAVVTQSDCTQVIIKFVEFRY
jgi:hypothetical protein